MNMSASWVAVRGADRAAVLDRIGWIDTGEDDPDLDAPLACGEIGDWIVLLRMHDAEELLTDKQMAALSAGGDAISFWATDVAMGSEAAGYRNGQCAWRVGHDPDADVGLQITGEPPMEFGPIREGLESKQAEGDEDVDYLFDAPLILSAKLCGFRPDNGVEDPAAVFRPVEARLQGKAGEAQLERKRRTEALGERVRTELLPEAASLGFEPLLHHPEFHRFYPFGVSQKFVRLRGERSESLDVYWGFVEGGPTINLQFFVRFGSEPRYGGSGSARVPTPHRSFMDRIKGKMEPADQALDRVIVETKALLHDLDRHLRGGTPHPWIKPAAYMDEVGRAAFK